MNPIFCPCLFLIVESWTLALAEAREACSSLYVLVGSLVTSSMSCDCVLGDILAYQLLLGRFTCSKCTPFGDMALTVVSGVPQP
uniref:Secreted protein n=1 Tax=Anguilla anguilla TaxID=7936 RepID=A0A0E9TYN6_ANGAN